VIPKLNMCARTSLPIPGRPFSGTVMYEAKNPDSMFPPIEEIRPPEGAPNVP
jgi:arylsulfatase